MSGVQRIRGILVLCLVMETISGTSSSSPNITELSTRLSALQSKMETLLEERMRNKERVAQLKQSTQELENNITLLETTCSTTNVDTETQVSGSGSILIVGGGIVGGMAATRVVPLFYGDCTELSIPVDNLPRPYGSKSHVSGWTYDGVMLTCGGSGSSSIPIFDCIYFNTETRDWEIHSSLPGQRKSSGIVFTENGTYILGGGPQGNDHSIKKTSLFLPLGGNSWTEGPEIPGDGIWDSCVLDLNSTHAIIIGGLCNGTQVRLWEHSTNTWTEWPNLPHDVFGAACIRTEDGVMVTGGAQYDTFNTYDKTLMINAYTGVARRLKPMMQPREGHGIFMVGNKVIVIGGYKTDHNHSDSEQYNGDTWEKADYELSFGRHSFSTITVPNCVV